LIEPLASGGNSSGLIVEHRGDILFRLDRKEEAKAEWLKAKSLGDYSDTLELKLTTGQLAAE
jgi:predicted negative regulator of RcsB-dependent stress response